MTMRPDSGPEFGHELWEAPEPSPTELVEEERELYGGERELYEHEEEARELVYRDPEDNELHVRGQTCERCGSVIGPTQDARMLPDGHWIHEICPIRH